MKKNFQKHRFSLLITDDDRSFRETLQEILEPEGFQTVLAESGEEALDWVKRRKFHLALMDYQMPRLSGLETLQIMRRTNLTIPAILLTGHPTDAIQEQAESARVFCVISKPVEKVEVVHTVHRALEIHYLDSDDLGGVNS